MSAVSDPTTFADDRRCRLTAFAASPQARSTRQWLKVALERINADDDADDIHSAMESAWQYVEIAATTVVPSSGSPQSDQVEIIHNIGGKSLAKLLDCIVDIEDDGGRVELLRREFREHLIGTIGSLSREIAVATGPTVIWAGASTPTEWDIDDLAAGLEVALDDQGAAVKFSDLQNHYLTADDAVADLVEGHPDRRKKLREMAVALLQFASCVDQLRAVGKSMPKSAEGGAS